MLETIISGKSYPEFILIQDENASKALNLFKGILKKDIANNDIKEINMICTRNPPEFYLGLSDSKKILVHNLFRDPCCWIESSSCDCDLLFKNLLVSQELKSTIMIESINPIILMKDINYVSNIIHKLKERFMRVVCLIQGDTISDTDCLKKLSFLCSIFVKVHQNFPENISNRIDKHCLAVEGVHKKPNGKVVLIKELCRIDENYVIHSEIYKKRRDHTRCTASSMRGLTTFRMGLDIQENEKIARDNLILPYLRNANKKNGSEGEKSEGKIVYYAESGDDLEEDPDDDLDI